MTGQQILAMCAKIIKRSDLDNDLLLLFINQQRKTVMRSVYLYKLEKWESGLTPVSGLVSVPTLKQARYVEYELNSSKRKLKRLNTYNEAYEIYGDTDFAGTPVYYVVTSEGIRLIPVPTEGTINIYGEFYPADIANNATEDTLNKELSDAFVYLGCAEYFDMLGETDTASFWREKGNSMLAAYLSEIKKQMTDGVNMLARDPFGNLGMVHSYEYAPDTEDD